MIKEEARYLRVAMGHENEDLDEFVEAHKTCLNDLMYFPTRNAYGLSSVAQSKLAMGGNRKEVQFSVVTNKVQVTAEMKTLADSLKDFTIGMIQLY